MRLFKKKYPSLSFAENFLGGHVSLGPVTIYGENAMHWAVNISTKRWGYVCFRLPLRCFGRWWPLYVYCSPDATPSRATWWLAQDSAVRMYGRLNRVKPVDTPTNTP